MGYTKNPEIKIFSRKFIKFSPIIFDNKKGFSYEPNENTKKLFGSTCHLIILLTKANDIDLE